jgi:alkylation response protein AidB-like acyl-CoA dehydrogenase
VTEEEIRAAIAVLVPEIENRGDEIAQLRRLPTDLVASLKGAGAFRIARSRASGGPELTPRAQTEIVETLSHADPSVGWCVMIGSDSPYWGSFLEPDVAAKLFADPDAVSAGLVMPAGQAVARDGGYLVNGHWAFGSGCTHADIIVAGCLVLEGGAPRMREDGNPDWRIMAAPAASFDILDTWYTAGLAGSGSNDYTTTDLFVPAEHSFSFYDSPRRSEPLYAFHGMFVTNMPGVPLGIARRAIDLVRDIAADKLVIPDFVLMRDLPRVHLALARAETMLGAARAFVYESLDRLWDTVVAGDPVSPPIRYAISLSRAHAFRAARDVTQLMCDTAGGSSIYAKHPLERLLRDVITINQHIVAQERVLEVVGASMLTGSDLPPAL